MDKSPHFKSEPPAPQSDVAPKPPLRRVNSEETERPPSAQRVQRDAIPDSEASDEDELDADPAEKIVDFNWDELHQRYHSAMDGCHTHEAELAQEWESLMNYFRVWAESGHTHETDRTFQRLKTRTSHVQNSENSLEQRRHHCKFTTNIHHLDINVVKAFESALSLLKATSYGR
ncbi:hypothetical protein DE146DRAFT_625558 [Phaeosphaeria sp. MPI-PUGE-AT-0046c]|nr:hypothetical protein DE146DRAFT_625558 [Phaeosphaeria sp. MPI-PUGE-AT-0046c]